MAGKLVHRPGNQLERRIDPPVLTKAQPAAIDLLQARRAINANPALPALFEQAFKEDRDTEWLVEQLAAGLVNEEWLGSLNEAREAAQYLVDEYHQLGEGVHLVSSATGKVVTTLTEADVWQPAPVPREGGGMATPMPQLRPDLASFLVTWSFDR